MKRIKFFSALAIITMVLVSSCKCPFRPKGPIEKSQEQTEIEITKSFGDPKIDTTLEFTIDTAALIDNVLFAKVSYYGEKSDISFKLVWNGTLLKSYPPKAIVYLDPQIKEIKGKQLVSHKLYFDMSPMLPMDSYDEVVLLLKDYNGSL